MACTLDKSQPKFTRRCQRCASTWMLVVSRRFHDLRHSAASLLLASGVELVEVSKLLGHSEMRVTADLYGHLVKQTATKAARIMDGLLQAKV